MVLLPVETQAKPSDQYHAVADPSVEKKQGSIMILSMPMSSNSA